MFGRKCSSPGYGFVSGILFYFLFFWQPWARTFTVGKHLALRNPSNMGKFPGIRLGNQDLWGGEKESTFDTGRRVETGTYHWEGRKPFVQTFEITNPSGDGLLVSVLTTLGSTKLKFNMTGVFVHNWMVSLFFHGVWMGSHSYCRFWIV